MFKRGEPCFSLILSPCMCFVTSPPHSLKWLYILWANIPVLHVCYHDCNDGEWSSGKFKKMCIFLLFPCQCFLQSYTSYGTQLQISDKAQIRLWIYYPAQMWIICLPTDELPGNSEECLQQQFFHLSGAVGTLHVQVCKVDTCIAKHITDWVQPGCSASTASHRMFYEDTSLSHLNWLRGFCFHSACKSGVVEKSGKKYHTFPDCLYLSCILIWIVFILRLPKELNTKTQRS